MSDTQTFKEFFTIWRDEHGFKNGTDWTHLDLINGWTDPAALTMLATAVSLMCPGEHYLEIGTYCGKSICAALEKNNTKHAQVIDPFGIVLPDGDAIEAAWERNTAGQGVRDRIQLHKTTSASFAETLPPIGVYYYDGSHEIGDTYHGLVAFEHFLADKAIIIVDDVAMPEVAPDVAEYVATRSHVELLGHTPFKPYHQAVMILER